MLKKSFLYFIILNLCSFLRIYSATYYISNNGNDFNNGLSQEYPFKTISKLNSVLQNIEPGDIVLFQKGNYFSGQIELVKGGNMISPVTFGAYGEGRDPVISGAIPVTGWKVYFKKIYFVQVNANVKNFFANGKQMILARYPNKGLLTVEHPFANPKKGFNDRHLTQKEGYWTGGNVRARTINYAYEYSPVEKYVPGAVTLKNEVMFPFQTGWGYYLDNVLSELDSENEWFYKPGNENLQNGTLYFYPPRDINPEKSFIEGSIFDYGFFSDKPLSDIIIRDLDFRNQNVSGIFFSGNKSRIVIDNCSFSGQMQTGFESNSPSENFTINNCRFSDINGKAISIINLNNSVISNNIITNIGMLPGYGTTSDPFGMSGIIILNSNSNHIYKNYLNRIGHDGINCIGLENVIEKNIISNALLQLNDGAAIKSFGHNNTNSVWNKNFIFNVPGNLTGVPKKIRYVAAAGLYPDEHCSNMKLTDNTITGCGLAAINFYNGNHNNLITGNLCYNNGTGIIFYKGNEMLYGNSTIGNIFFGINENQYAVLFRTGTTGFNPGNFENNYYGNPYNNKLFTYQAANHLFAYDLSEWKELSKNNYEKNSKFLTGTAVIFSQLFYNMNDDIITMQLDNTVQYKDIDMRTVSGSITIPAYTSKILFANQDINSKPQIYSAGGPLDFGNNNSVPMWYLLTANNISGNVIVSAPPGFVVSTEDDNGYAAKLTLDPEGGMINKIIFVKFIPAEVKSYGGFITNESKQLKTSVTVKGEGSFNK